MKYLIIIFSIVFSIINSYSQDNTCPCDDPTYKYLNQKPINELTQKDMRYINDIEENCARYILPDYDDYKSWDLLGHIYDLDIFFYRPDSFLYSDSIITLWVKKITLIPSEHTYRVDIEHLKYYLKTKENQKLSYIWLTNNDKVIGVSNTADKIDKIPPFNTYGYILYESVLNVLLKGK